MPHLRAWIPLLCLTAALGAAEEGPVRFGLQATCAFPRQDAKDLAGRSGFGGGIFFEQDLPGDLALRSRFDYQALGRSPASALANQASLGADLRFAPSQLHGFFILGGAFGTRVETQTPATKDKTSFKFGVAAGAGCRLSSHSTLTARYTLTSLDAVRWATLEAGLDYRF
jgi:opacity protein-like surface antigen